MSEADGRTPDSATVSSSTEAAIIEIFTDAATRAVAGHSATELVVDNGDDAAVFASSTDVVASTDMIVEGTHFRRDWSSPAEIGARAVAQASSDIAAMGAHTRYIVIALSLPGDMRLTDVEELASGAATEARRAGARIIGGDITTGPCLVLAPMALGDFDDAGSAAVRLSGARPGDTLALSGMPGRSAAGLELITAGHAHGVAQDLFRVPQPEYELGPQARDSGASALTDVTDGLLRDLSGLCRASGVVADLDPSTFVDDEVLRRAAALLEKDAGPVIAEWQLTGGEDHGLLACFPPGTQVPEGFATCGVIREATAQLAAGTVLVDGAPAKIAGWDSARGAQT